jgi:hypothetical protein
MNKILNLCADTRQTTALHYISSQEPEILQTLMTHDEPAAKRAINHLAVSGSSWNPIAQSPLMSAILKGNAEAVMKLLDAGAEAYIDFKAWLKSVEMQFSDVASRDSSRNHQSFFTDVEQPVILAAQGEFPELVSELLQRGADPNTLPKETKQYLETDYYWQNKETLLELVRKKIRELRAFKDHEPPQLPQMRLKEGVDYLEGIEPGSYKEASVMPSLHQGSTDYIQFVAKLQVKEAQSSDQASKAEFEESLKRYHQRKGFVEKKQAIDRLVARFVTLEEELLARGAKTFEELYPDKVMLQADLHSQVLRISPC